MKKNPHEVEDRARLMGALVLSIIIMLGFHFFVIKPQQERVQKQAAAVATQKQNAEIAKNDVKILPRADVVNAGGRIQIVGKQIRGSLPLKGARIDDILLNEHFTTTDNTDNVPLLSPAGTEDAYYVETGWLAAKEGMNMPGPDTVWHLASGSADKIVSGGPAVVLQWDNGQGLTFERSIALDEHYLFTVTQKVVNKTGGDVVLNAYHLAARHSLPHDFKGFFVLHEGPVGYIGNKLKEPSYKDLSKGDKIEVDNTDGWVGISDKYWLVALLPQKDKKFNARIMADTSGAKPVFQTDTVSPAVTVPMSGSAEDVSYIYAGVKDMPVMKTYEKDYGFNKLELGIDFGMWSFITKPFFYLLHFLMHTIGNVGAAILLMTVIVRTAVFPLASKSFRSMAKMKVVAPKLKELQEQYKHDKNKLQMEIFELYKKEDVNPFSGCWPMLIQIPIFFALYKVILISVELRHAPFWGWIHDLSAPDPTSVFNLFGLIPWTPPTALMIGVWPVLFCISMVVQKRLSPPLADPTQEKIQTYFPYIVTVMMAHFAVGLVIYWTWSNVLGTLQQYYILKKVGGEDTSLIRGHSGRRKKKG